MRPHRKAFSSVELVIVAVVMLLLAGLVVYGLMKPSAAAQIQQTRATMENLRNMLEEARRGGAMREIHTGSITAPVAVNIVPADPNIQATQAAMARLRTIQSNRAALSQLPAEQLARDGTAVLDPPVVLDAWGKAILYVPGPDLTPDPSIPWDARYGLVGVSSGAVPLRITAPANTPYPTNPGSNPARLGPALKELSQYRPFFVSAGPDGNYTTGDDNIYSFQD